MMKTIIFFIFAVAGCLADPVPDQPECKLLKVQAVLCIGSPNVYKSEWTDTCKHMSPCESAECFFTNSGFVTDGKLNKTKMAEYYDEFASKNKEWTTAVSHVKSDCLGEQDLPAQGTRLNCWALDIITCAHARFFRYALPTQWLTNPPECQEAKTYYANCPYCAEDDCITKPVAPGTCNCRVPL